MKVYILNKYTKIYLVFGKIVFFNFELSQVKTLNWFVPNMHFCF